MRTGQVKFFNQLQGFGYILQLDGSEVYFHYTAIAEKAVTDHLELGMSVAYDLIETRMGPEASNVRLASPRSS